MIRKIYSGIIVLLMFFLYSCNNSRKEKFNANSTQDSMLIKIQHGLSKMPLLPRKTYVIFDSQKKIFLLHTQISEIQSLEKINVSTEKYKSIEDLLDMELGLGINELLKIDKLNYSYLPANRKYFYVNKGVGISEKYVSRKTNSVVNGFVYFKTKEKYFTYHIADTVDFDLNIIGTIKDSNELSIVYETLKDSKLESENALIFKNDTIILYKLNVE